MCKENYKDNKGETIMESIAVGIFGLATLAMVVYGFYIIVVNKEEETTKV